MKRMFILRYTLPESSAVTYILKLQTPVVITEELYRKANSYVLIKSSRKGKTMKIMQN